VVYKIVETLRSETTSAADLEREISVDPGFSAKVLQQANSAYYALPRPVRSVKEAVTLLGFKQVRFIAMQAGVFDFFVGKNDKDSLRRRQWWRHALDTAQANLILAKGNKTVQPDIAYTAGLFHSLGRTLLCRNSAPKYDKVEFLMEKGAPAWQAEQAVFGCHHGHVVIAAAQAWRFPDDLSQCLDYLEPAFPGEPGAEARANLYVAHLIATFVQKGAVPNMTSELLFPSWVYEVLAVEPEKMGELVVVTLRKLIETAKHQ
jgi:HD-like signal output (HDOD) protein